MIVICCGVLAIKNKLLDAACEIEINERESWNFEV